MSIDIIVKDFDNKSNCFIIKRNGKNIFMEMGVCQFEDDMEYWDMPTKLVEFNGEKGYIFSKDEPIDEVTSEIKRFIRRYELEKEI